MGKQPQATAITRENIIAAFWMLYKEKGIDKISVKEIANIAGYNRSTFYEYFTDVYDLLNDLEDDVLDYFKERLMNDLDILNDDEVIKRVTAIYEAKGEYLSVFLTNAHFTGKLRTLLKPIIYLSLPIKKDNIYLDFIIEFAISSIIGTLTYWYQHQQVISLNEAITLVRSMLTKGTLQEMQKHL